MGNVMQCLYWVVGVKGRKSGVFVAIKKKTKLNPNFLT